MVLAGLVLAACAGAASVADAPRPLTAAAATSSPAATPASATLAWTVAPSSTATVRVREQLASINFPSDAVLVAKGGTGSFQLNADGTFDPASKIMFNVDSLASDSSQRDGFVKMTVLNTRQFPTATFVPTRATGLTTPLPANGTFSFTLAGTLTIHGVTRGVTFGVTATRSAADLKATVTLDPTVTFGDFGMPLPAAPGRVLSVVDEIKLVIDLVATGPSS